METKTSSLSLLLLTTALALVLASACSKGEPRSQARRVSTRADLIGGPGALGEVGDYLLENDKIRVIIQDKGFSRGFGVYGGSLIDADRVRAIEGGDSSGGLGRDRFGEMFPVFFLQALVPEHVEVVNDGSDGKAASVRVTGNGGDFLTLTRTLNQAVLNSHELPSNPLDLLKTGREDGTPQLSYEMLYELEPGARHITMKAKLSNVSGDVLEIPSKTAKALLQMVMRTDAAGFQVPMGTVLLFGAGNKMFALGAGYDIRFTLEDGYDADLAFPAFPGVLTDVLLSTSKTGVSYGFFAKADPQVENFTKHRTDDEGKNVYKEAYGIEPQDDTLLIPFVASAFTGVFSAQMPTELGPGESFSYTNYFAVGDGDAASIMDIAHEVRGTVTGTVRGAVRHALTGEPVAMASVVISDDEGKVQNQAYTDDSGHFLFRMAPGSYTARVQKHPMMSEPVSFTVAANKASFLELSKPAAGHVLVQVRDSANNKLPARVTVIGTTDPEHAVQGLHPRQFLFDLAAGESWRENDFIPDDPNDPETRRYVEAFVHTEDGRAYASVRPGREYTVYVSRGIEYSIHSETVTPGAGQTVQIAASLERIVETTGYISGDFHLHAAPSLDSDLSLEDRVLSAVGEGLEYLVATDHNFITDYKPTIERLGLQDWANSMIGIELTTLETGHFNGFPLKREVGKITKGSFEWSLKPPGEVFEIMRSLGAHGPEHTLVQANHPRDDMLGYFGQYDLDALTGELAPKKSGGGIDVGAVIAPSGPAFLDAEGNSTFSLDFEALEVLNGSLPLQVHHERRPASLAGRDVPEETLKELEKVEAGAIMCEDGEVAFPGVVDDWYNFLNAGRRYVATANSDSHYNMRPGYPRTYIAVGDDPAAVDELTVADALLDHRATLTYGPFVELFVNGEPIGSKIADSDGTVDVLLKVRVAPWIKVKEGRIVVNGETAEFFAVNVKDGSFEYSKPIELKKDSWLVAEVWGDESMFPIVLPVDLEPLLLDAAFAAFAGPLGFGASIFGDIEPKHANIFKPFGLTNPVWVDVDGGGFEAPGVLPRKCDGWRVVPDVPAEPGGGVSPMMTSNLRPELISIKRQLKPSFMGFPRVKGNITDVRILFEHFGAHSH